MHEDNIARTLGRIEGRLEGIRSDVHDVKESVDGLDERMRGVETRVAINSGVISTVVSAGVAGLVTALTPGV